MSGAPVAVEEPRIYRIKESRRAAIDAAIEKLRKRAAKVGAPMPAINISPLREQTFKDELTALPEVRRWYEVTIDDPAPLKLAGWTFLGTLDHATEAGVIVRAVPGVEFPASYRDAKPVCNHCGTSRIRRETFIVEHEDGTRKQVGRNCVADFLGVDPASLIARLQWNLDLFGMLDDEDMRGGASDGDGFDLEFFLAVVALCIRKHGWTSRTVAREHPGMIATSVAALNTIAALRNGDRKSDWYAHPEAVDCQTAAEALTWARGLREANPGRDLSDYEHNLFVVCAGVGVRMKNTGIAASAVSSYQRHVGRMIERARIAKVGANSTHVGTVGEREEFDATVVSEKTFESDFGARALIKFIDDAGNVLIWWTSPQSFRKGEHVHIKATIKEHSTYKETKQTVIARAVVVEPSPFLVFQRAMIARVA